MFERLIEMLDRFIELGTPGYDMCIFKDGREVFRRQSGYSDKENLIPMKGDELFYIYSVCKVITVTAALQLYERGLFSLDDPIADYAPEFREMKVRDENGDIVVAKNQITVRDLFRMTAGFNYRMKSEPMVKFCEMTEGRCPTRDLTKYLSEAVLDFEPGTKWQYSLCHDLLAAFIEIWSGERFGEYVKKNIFDPSGMTRSTFYLPPEQRHLLSPQYRYDSNLKQTLLTEPTNVYSMWPEYESGGGGCVSTVDDMMKFAEALRCGKLLKPETLEIMSTSQIDHCLDSFILSDYSYGLGVRCSRVNDGISDIGWGGAAGASLWIDLKNGISAFYCQHVLNTNVIKARNRIFFLVKECFGLADSEKITDSEDTSRDAFAAKYGN